MSTDSDSSNRLEIDNPNMDIDLFEKIGEAGYERYGTDSAQIAYEETALSVASIKLFQTHGTKVEKVPMLRHPLFFGPSERFKSQMVQDFREHFLPKEFQDSQIDSSTPRALIGSIDPDSGDIYAPDFTTKQFVQIEWDTLSSMDGSQQVKGVFYKALEDGVIRNDMVSTAKADVDEGTVHGGTLGTDVRKDKFTLEFDVKALITGVVHLESEFWREYDKAFYNRWLPVYIDPEEGFVGKARQNSERLDQDEAEIQREFRQLFNHVSLTKAFKSVKPDVYRDIFREHLGFESPRFFNKMNVTLSCKALLEGHIDDGEVEPTRDDIEWLQDRMETVYAPHYNEMLSYTETNVTNERRRADRLDKQMEIVEYLVKNDGSTVRELAREFSRPSSTIRDYLTKKNSRLANMVSSDKEMTSYGRKPVYRLKQSKEDR